MLGPSRRCPVAKTHPFVLGVARLLATVLRAVALTVFTLACTAGALTAYGVLTQGHVAGATAPIDVVQLSEVNDLNPGASDALFGDFDNHNPTTVSLAVVRASVVPFQAQRNRAVPACTQADFAIVGTSKVSTLIPSGSKVGSWSGLTLLMKASAPSNCADIDLSLTYQAK
jgi:hypothetical protein